MFTRGETMLGNNEYPQWALWMSRSRVISSGALAWRSSAGFLIGDDAFGDEAGDAA